MDTATARALGAAAYDLGRREWSDFIRSNRGARHRRRVLSLMGQDPI